MNRLDQKSENYMSKRNANKAVDAMSASAAIASL